MKQRLALLAVVAAGLAAPAWAVAPGALASVSAVAKTCSAGYVHADLSWGQKCLRAGEFCKVGNRQYVRYGFVCPSSGHLKRR